MLSLMNLKKSHAEREYDKILKLWGYKENILKSSEEIREKEIPVSSKYTESGGIRLLSCNTIGYDRAKHQRVLPRGYSQKTVLCPVEKNVDKIIMVVIEVFLILPFIHPLLKS